MKKTFVSLVLVVAILALSCVSCSKATPESTPSTDTPSVETDISAEESAKDIGWEIHGNALYTPEGEYFFLKERGSYEIVAYNDTECIIISCYNELLLFNEDKELSYYNDGKPIKSWELDKNGFLHWDSDNCAYAYFVKFSQATA